MPRKKVEPHFIERPVPSEREVRNFERQIRSEKHSEDINSRLSEIYRDDRGRLVDVKKMEKRARRLAIVIVSRWLFGLIIVSLIAYVGFLFFSPSAKTDVELAINAPEKIKAGQEFVYRISYRNNTNKDIQALKLELFYPENFVFVNSDLVPASKNNYWTLPDLPAGTAKSFEVKGRIINQENSANIVYAKLTYRQANFSSELKKEASVSSLIENLGFRAEVDYPGTALAGAENDLSLKISNFDAPLISKFRIDFEAPSAITIIDPLSSSTSFVKKVEKYWQVDNLPTSSPTSSVSSLDIPFRFKINNFDQNRLEVVVRLSVVGQDGKVMTFFEKRAGMDVIKNDLNLTMMVNGSQGDRSVNFGEKLNYTISYANKGTIILNNVALSAVVDSPFIDWDTLAVESSGKLKDGIITWTKDELPALMEIKPGQEGDLNFSVRVKKFSNTDLGNNFAIKSYAQFNVNSNTVSSELNRGNVINSRLNSDLSFTEKILYFDDNNSPVGEGPLPPKVGEKTSVRVYWELNNTLHELDKTKVSLALPPNTSFTGKTKVQAGSIYYDQAFNQVVWDIGRVPLSVTSVRGEFVLSLIPTASDQNKILIISPGSQVQAIDLDNNSEIKLSASPKTTKLEDDDIAGLSNSGKVQ